MPKFAIIVIVSVLLVLVHASVALTGPLTVKEIIAMSRSGIPDEVIIEKIRNSETHLDLTINEIIDIKRKGVSIDVIRELLQSIEAPGTNVADTSNKGTAPVVAQSSLPQQQSPPPVQPTAQSAVLPTPTPKRTMIDKDGSVAGPHLDAQRETGDIPSPGPDLSNSQTTSLPSESRVEQETDDTRSILDDVSISVDETASQGIMKIHSTPAKAQVFFDGKQVGYTPYYTNIRFEGRHSLVLKKKWYRDLRVEIDLERTTVRDIHLPLELERPLIIISWTVEDASLSSLYWSMQSCSESIIEGMIPLELIQHEDADTVVYSVDETLERSSVAGALACLQGMIWLSSKVPLTMTGNNQVPVPDSLFYLTNIELSNTEIVELKVSVQLDRRYPQGLRLVLTGNTGQLIRISN